MATTTTSGVPMVAGMVDGMAAAMAVLPSSIATVEGRNANTTPVAVGSLNPTPPLTIATIGTMFTSRN